MDEPNDDDNELPLHLARQLDALCDEFEKRLAAGEAVDFESYLNQIEPMGRRQLIGELVALAVERLRSLGVADPGQTIIAQNPGLRDDIEAALGYVSDVRLPSDGELSDEHIMTHTFTPRGRKSRGLRIRCPHCSNHIEVVGDTPLDSVNCTVCGSTFSLVDRSQETRLAQSLQKIDRFELISRLGVGGFGTVWKARDTELDRAVAVKIPRRGQLSAAEMDQFLREARSAAQLRHPNIVAVHEVGREGDALFIVSDLIRGVSLADVLTGKRPTPREAAELCATVAKALDHAHRKGIVHRDLKPSNVMIGDDGTPYLMDFGLAKREAEEVTMTAEGQIIGTPAYMSPEQAGGRSAWADRRTDVYSLGVILFELLTGELPFRGNAQMQVHRRLNEDAPNVLSLNRHLPKDLATICEKCMEREPGRRYPTAHDVADELGRYLDKLPIKARPLSPVGRVARWAARRPLQAVVAGLVLFLAVAGPATALVIRRQNARLGELLTEQGNLIEKRERENREAISRSARMQDRLDVWEGRANPWAMWPPDPGYPPKHRELASLLAARGDELQEHSDADSNLVEAQCFLSLAILYESSSRHDEAERCLLRALDALKDLRDARPRSIAIGLCLADCYEQLSALTAARDLQESSRWLAEAVELRRSLVEDHPGDPLLQAYQLDSELRLGAAAGFEKAQEQLAAAEKLDEQLQRAWPESPSAIYRLACLLSGRSPWLAEEPADDGGAVKASGD